MTWITIWKGSQLVFIAAKKSMCHRRRSVRLNELRCIKERMRDLKKKISDLSAGLVAGTRDDLMILEKQMEDLKESGCPGREKAAGCQERMIILGHEQPATK